MLEKMLKDYHAKGLMTKDKNMKVMKVASKHFHRMKEHDPEMCEELLREIHEIYCGPHYTKFFAVMDVKEMHHTDRNGHEVEGEHWTIEEAKMKMKEHKLPADVNEYDFYVAINANYHDKVKLFVCKYSVYAYTFKLKAAYIILKPFPYCIFAKMSEWRIAYIMNKPCTQKHIRKIFFRMRIKPLIRTGIT